MNDSIYKTYKPAGGSEGLFLKLQDGDSVKLRIASEPAIFEQEFTNDGEITISTKFAWVVWNRNEQRAQIFNGGKSIYNQVADLVDEWGEPTGFDINVKRAGQMLETRYSVTPLPKSEDLSSEEQAECDKIELLKAVKGRWLKEFNTPEEEISKEDLNKIFADEDEKGKKL